MLLSIVQSHAKRLPQPDDLLFSLRHLSRMYPEAEIGPALAKELLRLACLANRRHVRLGVEVAKLLALAAAPGEED